MMLSPPCVVCARPLPYAVVAGGTCDKCADKKTKSSEGRALVTGVVADIAKLIEEEERSEAEEEAFDSEHDDEVE
jgi:hypothetical protein